MAGTSLLALLDDIATVLDDIALMTKVAAKKTAGVLGDDLALNAEQVFGIRAERELPVVWAVAKGSLKNKLILVPAALAISAVAPWAIAPLLMVGGAYLCFEGFEKVFHKLLHGNGERQAHREAKLQALQDPDIDLVAFEKAKVKGAVRTDFILSAEIIVIALGTVQGQAMFTQVVVVSGIALLMTAGVYGIVAGIVKLDDAGLYLTRETTSKKMGKISEISGKILLNLAPWLMKTLSVVGTAAMFMVGGGILMHGLPAAHHLAEFIIERVQGLAGLGPILGALTPLLLNIVAGVLAGAMVTAVVGLLKTIVSGKSRRSTH